MLDAENPAETTSSAPAETTSSAPAEATDRPADSVDEPTDTGAGPAKKTTAKRTATKKTAAKKTAAKKAPVKRTTRKVAATTVGAEQPDAAAAGASAGAPEPPLETSGAPQEAADTAPAKKTARKTATKKAATRRPAKKAAASTTQAPDETPAATEPAATEPAVEPAATEDGAEPAAEPAATEDGVESLDEETPDEDTAGAQALVPQPAATALLFQPPDPTKAMPRKRKTADEPVAGSGQTEATAEDVDAVAPTTSRAGRKRGAVPAAGSTEDTEAGGAPEDRDDRSDEDDEQGGERRRRRRGGRRRRRSGGGEGGNGSEESQGSAAAESADEPGEPRADGEEGDEAAAGGTRRRRRRRRAGEGTDGPDASEGDGGTVTRVRKPRNAEDEITSVSGSTRLEAKKQRRREGREAGRRRAPIVSEAEFLARREAVDRVMVIRQRADLTQIAVLEDKILVEHYVARESQTSLIGNVYLGRVQNVLPSMEAAFVDIGKGRNAVLYAGEVNWEGLGAKNGTPRKIEAVLKSGQPILVQVTKDPVGHKGARLTSQVSLPGRFLVYVPDGTTSGISRKLPDTERSRLKSLLKDIVPETAGVIVRTAAEGASEEELTRDVERLTARWADIESKVRGGNAPQLLYGEPDLTLKVVRDLFTEDFSKLVISGDDAWDLVQGYVAHVAPELEKRLERYDGDQDVFAEYRIDEQIEKGLDRKVWLPSGGSLVIDRTEAMTVVDVNTGKFTGSGGNLEETVTKNNLEAAEEIVRQLRLRDIGGIIVVDFIDMVLESNRDLVLRRMVECLGRDRTRHQVAEVTSLGLVQMTRKRIGTGLLEAFSEVCEHCQGRGVVLHHEPVEPKRNADEQPRRGGRRSGRGRGGEESGAGTGSGSGIPSPKDIAAMARHDDRRAEAAEGVGPQEAEVTPASEAEPAVSSDLGVEQAAGGPAEPREQGRSRGRRSRGSSRGPSEETVEAGPEAPETSVPEASVPEASVPEASVPEASAPEASVPEAAPAAPAAPKVTTGPRRARATRPAGTHVPQEGRPDDRSEDRPQSDSGGAVGSTSDAAEEIEGVLVDAAAEPQPVVAVPPPRIVTSTRRRSVRRPAGPPVAAEGADRPSGSGAQDGSSGGSGADGPAPSPHDAVTEVEQAEGVAAAGVASDEHSASAHVPVKKKGSRRR